jgi:uncharacterized protein (TIGR00369 family)
VTIENSRAAEAPNDHAYCMMCGDRNPWSLGLNFRAGEETMVCARFRANRALQGYRGILHGGMIAALLDAAMTHCLFRRGIQALTADLHVRFLRPIPCGALVDLRAWITAETPRRYRVKAELVLEQQVMAWAEAAFMPR